MSDPVTDQLMGRINRQVAIALDSAMEEMAADLREQLSKPGPSAPGEFPGLESGELKGSVSVQKSQISVARVSAGVVANAPYAEFLENGTERMAARPFREPMEAKWTPIVTQRLQQAASAATAEASIENPTDFFADLLGKGLEPNRTSL